MRRVLEETNHRWTLGWLEESQRAWLQSVTNQSYIHLHRIHAQKLAKLRILNEVAAALKNKQLTEILMEGVELGDGEPSTSIAHVSCELAVYICTSMGMFLFSDLSSQFSPLQS